MHPYRGFDKSCFWNTAIDDIPWHSVFMNAKSKFKLQKTDTISTAGSCFAQRISKYLSSISIECANFEPPPINFTAQAAEESGYKTYSARFGNIYTVAQLRQLIDEAFGVRDPIFEISQDENTGKFIDLMRPSVNGMGFSSEKEANHDRVLHLRAVRELFTESTVFIFTLGLTEAWISDDGIVFGSHPNVLKGVTKPYRLTPINYNYGQILDDLIYINDFLNKINPELRFILTVSPVGLSATHQNKHVLLATSYSKSVLRSVAGYASDNFRNFEYFMSYEIFNCSQSYGQYLHSNLREVNMRGVAVTMNVFSSMFLMEDSEFVSSGPSVSAAAVECEEILNGYFSKNGL